MISMIQSKAIHDSMATAVQSQYKITEVSEKQVSTFQDLISAQINETNNLQYQSDMTLQGFLTGETDNLHDVMIAQEEAKIALEFLTKTRNSVVEMYQEIKNLQI